eukprot:gene19207-4435_t
MLVFCTGAVAILGTTLCAIPWTDWRERRGAAGPPTVFEIVFLSMILWIFGILVCFGHFKMSGGDVLPEQMSQRWACVCFAAASCAHWAMMWLVLSYCLEYYREGKLM